jgi:hypothetical protein
LVSRPLSLVSQSGFSPALLASLACASHVCLCVCVCLLVSSLLFSCVLVPVWGLRRVFCVWGLRQVKLCRHETGTCPTVNIAKFIELPYGKSSFGGMKHI